MSLSPGSRLGPYEIVSPLGAGGMGEVYRARESHLLAALNHHNIASIYGVDEQGGTTALVMELVEGALTYISRLYTMEGAH